MKKILIVLSVVIALCIGFVVFMTCGNKKTTAKIIKEYESKGMKVASVEDDLKFDFNDSYKTCELKEVNKVSNFDVVVIPEEVEGYKVTSIGMWAFGADDDLYGNKREDSVSSTVKEVVMPDTIIDIDEQAFQFCENLQKVILGKNIEHIDEDAFLGCTALEELNLSETKLVHFKDGVFDKCTSLKKVVLPKQLESLAMGDFSGCYNIEELHIPGSVKKIDNRLYSFMESGSGKNMEDCLTIYAPKGSYAEEFAKETNTSFVAE